MSHILVKLTAVTHTRDSDREIRNKNIRIHSLKSGYDQMLKEIRAVR